MNSALLDLRTMIDETRLVDSHEHLVSEREWIEDGPDVLQDLFFEPYAAADLLAAGAGRAAVHELQNPTGEKSPGERFAAVEDAWKAMRHTGYGEIVGLVAGEVYGLDELTASGIEAAHERLLGLRQPGKMLELLADTAGLDHVQIDAFQHPYPPQETNGRPDFFLHDLSWVRFCCGDIDREAILAQTGIEIRGIEDLRGAIETIFDRSHPEVVAVKAQHAYHRTLRWQERSDEEADRALADVLRGTPMTLEERDLAGDLSGGGVEEASRLVLGDWCLARGVEQATAHDLPVKIHTGYYAGSGHMRADRIASGHLAPLLIRYPEARFVLMHIAYPYSDELIAIAKHFPNVWVDLCWAWSINPLASSEFVRRFLHAAPASKLFAFGGDTAWPTNVVAAASQARRWLIRTFMAEIEAGDLTEAEAIAVAERVMRSNQYACFDLGRFIPGPVPV